MANVVQRTPTPLPRSVSPEEREVVAEPVAPLVIIVDE